VSLSLLERQLLPHNRRLKLTACRVSNISGAKIDYLWRYADQQPMPHAAFIKLMLQFFLGRPRALGLDRLNRLIQQEMVIDVG
jgi:hypothetical protein